MTGTLVQFGFASYDAAGRALAAHWGLDYRLVPIRRHLGTGAGDGVHAAADMFQVAEALKSASFVLIWNGLQGPGPLATRLCRLRGIPTAYFEWGMLPQSETFFIDPTGLCSDSVLCRDLSWVTVEDVGRMLAVRDRLRGWLPRRDEGFILVPLQIHNDTSVLFHSRFSDMDEVVAEVMRLYPGREIVVRPHPKSKARRWFDGCRVETGGEFLEWASRASEVVGVTSTCLSEAAVYGVPVRALGSCVWSAHPREQHDTAAAGQLALTVRREGAAFGPVLERFNKRPREAAEKPPCSARSFTLVSV